MLEMFWKWAKGRVRNLIESHQGLLRHRCVPGLYQAWVCV